MWAVGRLVEVPSRAALDGYRGGIVGEQHGAEEGLLGFEVVRGDPATAGRGRSRTQGAGAGVVKGLDHGPPTLLAMSCGEPEQQAGDWIPQTHDAAVDNRPQPVEELAQFVPHATMVAQGCDSARGPSGPTRLTRP